MKPIAPTLDPVAFADRYLSLNEKDQRWTLGPYQRRVLAHSSASPSR